jgi:glycosyl transferase family 25
MDINTSNIQSFQDIQHVLYINLDKRDDRNRYIQKQLALVGLESKAQRVKAVELENGALGCSMSHLKCIEMAKKNKWPHVLVCEDDVTFLYPTILQSQFNACLEVLSSIGSINKEKEWDVILLAGNNMMPYKPVSDTCIQVTHCLTTTCYLVKSEYYDTLIQNYKEGIKLFMKNPENKKEYAIDKYWLRLQENDKWFLITPLTVIQREDYSDIEKKNTNFKDYFLNYNKCYKI